MNVKILNNPDFEIYSITPCLYLTNLKLDQNVLFPVSKQKDCDIIMILKKGISLKQDIFVQPDRVILDS